MSQCQRRKHLNKIHEVLLQESSELHVPREVLKKDDEATTSHCFTIVNKLFDTSSCQLSNNILQSMFAKAERLVTDGSNSICPSPGSVNAKLVASNSGQRPHYVVKKSSHKYNCDSDCPMWKCSKLCSHTIACAYLDGCLQEFLNKATEKPSFYALAKSGTALNVVKKPAKRKGIKKSTTKVMMELHDTVSAVASVSSLPSAPTVQRQGDNSSIGSTKTGGDRAVASSDISDSSLVHSPIVINQSVPAGIKISSSSLTQSPVVINQSVPSSVPVVQSSESSVNSFFKSPIVNSRQPTTNSPFNVFQNPIPSISQTVATGLLSALLIQQQASLSNIVDPFWIVPLFGNVSRCQGCSEKIMRTLDGKPLPAPDDLIVQHKEHVLFPNPKTGLFQLSHDLRNVYYHLKIECIRKKFPSFNPVQHLHLSNTVLPNLTTVHCQYLTHEFNFKY